MVFCESREVDNGDQIVVAVFGYGYWGPNIVRNFLSIGCNVKYIVDAIEIQQIKAKNACPFCNVVGDIDIVLNDPEVDAVIIVLPVSLHFDIAKKSLLSNKHVLVEKPLCNSVVEIIELEKIAKSKGLVLMVDHTYVYSPYVQFMKEHFKKQEMTFFDSERINLGKFQKDVNVVWDLIVHDLAILDYICPYDPISVISVGCSHTSSGLEDIAYVCIKYNEKFIVNLRISWVSPIKSRRIIVGGLEDMVIFDEMSHDKITVIDSRVVEVELNGKTMIECIAGSKYVPEIKFEEPLSIMANDFISSIKNGNCPIASPQSSIKVVKIIEAIQKSLKNGGMEVFLNERK